MVQELVLEFALAKMGKTLSNEPADLSEYN